MNNHLLKHFVFLFLLFLSNLIIAQDTIWVNSQRINTREQRLKNLVLEREIFVQKYVDSLNSYKNDGNFTLPYIFTCEDFDQKFGRKYWLSSHSPISIRKMIIDKVDNYDIFWCVNDSKDVRVFSKDTSKVRCFHCKVPFDQFSNYDLVNLRLDELMNDKYLRVKN